jgi:hypothetical protein
MAITYQTLAEWLVPAILAYAAWHLRCIHSELGKLNTNLAVLGERVDGHDRRITHLESA